MGHGLGEVGAIGLKGWEPLADPFHLNSPMSFSLDIVDINMMVMKIYFNLELLKALAYFSSSNQPMIKQNIIVLENFINKI